jgi:hypothetical protein
MRKRGWTLTYMSSGIVESKSSKAPKVESRLDTIEAIIRVAWPPTNWLGMV